MSKRRKIDNFSMRIWLETIGNVVGTGGLNSVLNYAHLQKYIDNPPPDNDELEIPVEDYTNFTRSLLEVFGSKGTRSLQLRAGREFVQIGVKKRPRVVKALQLGSRLIPETKRIHLVLEKWIEESEKRFPSLLYKPRIELKEEETYFFLTDKDHPESDGITSARPVCGIYAGILQAMIEWITGHTHPVEEIECRALGGMFDVFRISKQRSE
ncbi:MAG: 4-vinyl reductase [Candidatus Methanofastidiosia archaeon]